jgi:hypothetical protein
VAMRGVSQTVGRDVRNDPEPIRNRMQKNFQIGRKQKRCKTSIVKFPSGGRGLFTTLPVRTAFQLLADVLATPHSTVLSTGTARFN